MIIKCDETNVEQLNEMLKEFNISTSKEQMEDNPFVHYLAYKSNNELVGFIIFMILYEKAEINYIYVKPEYRHGLLGTHLLEEMMKYCFDEKVISITLEVRESNEAAIKLYEKVGFNSIAKRDKYYKEEDAILMEKVL